MIRRIAPAIGCGLLFCCVAAQAVDREAIEDAFGQPFDPSMRPGRIVSLSPNLTEMLFAIGVDPGRIVGVTRFCDEPAAAKEIPRVGGIVDPSVEGILALRPDLVLATRGNPVVILDRLRGAGLAVFAFESQEGLDRVGATMETMIRLVGPDEPARADSTLAAFAERLACQRRVASAIPDSARPSVYYYDPASPDWTSGPGTHIDEAIALSGGRNIAADAATAWPRYSVERLLAHPPDWILIAAPEGEGDAGGASAHLERLRARPGWRGIPAVREGRACVLPADGLMRPGPRVLPAIERLRRCLHPEIEEGCGP